MWKDFEKWLKVNMKSNVVSHWCGISYEQHWSNNEQTWIQRTETKLKAFIRIFRKRKTGERETVSQPFFIFRISSLTFVRPIVISICYALFINWILQSIYFVNEALVSKALLTHHEDKTHNHGKIAHTKTKHR